MLVIRMVWGFLSTNLIPALGVAAVAWVSLLRRKNKRLTEEVEHLEIKEVSNEVRRRPIPTDKSDILDRM